MHRNAQKDNIARSIVHEIKRRGGRFLRRHGSKGSKGSGCCGHDWMEIADTEAIEKTKQTIRDNKLQLQQDCNLTQTDDNTGNILSPATTTRPPLLSSIQTHASTQLQQPAIASHTLAPHRRSVKQQETGNTKNLESKGFSIQKKDLLPEPEPKRKTVKSQQWFSPPLLQPQQRYARHSLPMSHLPFYQQQIIDTAEFWNMYGRQMGTGITHNPSRTHCQDRLPCLCVRHQRMTTCPDSIYRHPPHQYDSAFLDPASSYCPGPFPCQCVRPRRIAAPPYRQHSIHANQIDSAVLGIPGAYQDLPSFILDNACEHARPYLVTPRDDVHHRLARSAANVPDDVLRFARVAKASQIIKDVKRRERPNDPQSLSEYLSGGTIPVSVSSRHRKHHKNTACRNHSKSPGSADQQPTEARRTGTHTTDGLSSHSRMITESAIMMKKRRRRKDDSPTSSTSSTLPLKKRAKRD